jgi:hypothetical protein
MDVNLGDGMSSVIPICRIVRAGSACADPRIITQAPSFGFVHDPSGLVNARRSAWEIDSDPRPRHVIINPSDGAAAIIELFGNGASEPFPHVAPTRPDG